MQVPNVEHPTTFVVRGHKVKVVAFCTLSNSHAANAARLYCRTLKLPKKVDDSKVYKLLTLYDQHNVGVLGT
jgi:hypothetical protein